MPTPVKARETAAGTLVLDVVGALDSDSIGAAAADVRAAVDQTECTTVVLDLRQCDLLAAAGVALCIDLDRELEQRGHSFSVVLSKQAERTLSVVGLLDSLCSGEHRATEASPQSRSDQ